MAKKTKVINTFPKDYFLLFLVISFIFIATSSLAINKGKPKKPEVVQAAEPSESMLYYLSPIPILAQKAAFPILSAQSVLAVDVDSGITLYEKNPDSPLLPASTTKIITALVALDNYDKNEVLTVDNLVVAGQRMGLTVGEKITVENLLYGLLVYSANDAAEVLADKFPGGRVAFIEQMNVKAKELSMSTTKFSNPSGLEWNDHVSTARDLNQAAAVAMKDPYFAKIVSTKEITVRSTNGLYTHKMSNINKLLGSVDGVLGVKTGWTENARENLVTYIERDGRRVIISLLASQDRFGETQELVEWVFENYTWKRVNSEAFIEE